MDKSGARQRAAVAGGAAFGDCGDEMKSRTLQPREFTTEPKAFKGADNLG